jgi:hypothetical protein
MPDQERMTIEERYKYLRCQQQRYGRADRQAKGRLLDEMEAVTGLHRKSLVRLMATTPKRRGRRRQRGPTYPQTLRQAAVVVAESLDWVCAERLKPNLEWLGRHLVAQGELELSDEELGRLGSMSTSTLRRILQQVPKERWRLPQRRGPAPNAVVAAQVAVERIPYDVAHPGHVEMDLVHHGGQSSQGEYLHTLQIIDVASGWSERAVVVGRSYVAMEAAIKTSVERLPFSLLEVHCDNGSEFLNHHLLRFWRRHCPAVRLTRSRPYHKNDNRFVEQKNSSLVRAYLGSRRLDSPCQAKVLDQAYHLMRLYYNLFQPVMHLKDKLYQKEPGGRMRIRRRYDEAATPLDRLIALGAIPAKEQARWLELRQSINPRHLRERIYSLLEKLAHSPGASGLGDVRTLIAAMQERGVLTLPIPKEAASAR